MLIIMFFPTFRIFFGSFPINPGKILYCFLFLPCSFLNYPITLLLPLRIFCNYPSSSRIPSLITIVYCTSHFILRTPVPSISPFVLFIFLSYFNSCMSSSIFPSFQTCIFVTSSVRFFLRVILPQLHLPYLSPHIYFLSSFSSFLS